MKLPLDSNASERRANKNRSSFVRWRFFLGYERVFTKATGLPLTLRLVGYWQREHHRQKPIEPIWASLAERPASVAVFSQAHWGSKSPHVTEYTLWFCGHGHLEPIASIIS